MAHLITRQDQAAKQLLPKGWAWLVDADEHDYAPTTSSANRSYYDDNGNLAQRRVTVWTWGTLVMERGKSLGERSEAYSALIKVLQDYCVHARVYAWDNRSTVKYPLHVQIMPMTAETLNELRAEYGMVEGTPNDTVYARWVERDFPDLSAAEWTMSDGRVIPPGTTLLNGRPLRCSKCGRVSPGLATDPDKPDNHYCGKCVRICPGSGDTRCAVAVFNQHFYGCEEHFPRASCPGCNKVFDIARNMGEHNGVRYCNNCLRTICARCGTVGTANGDYAVSDGRREVYNVCRDCNKAVREWIAQDGNEIVVLERPPSMTIPDNANRPSRLTSVELEVTGGASLILKDLYNKSLTSGDLCLAHWSNSPDFCYMERDGSLPDFPAGGEVIFSKMRLDDATTAKKLAEAVGIIRKRVKSGDAIIDLRTGTHVHIDFHKSGYNHARNLVILHNFAEDIIYRLGAANYTRHRGTHYAMVLPKNGLDTQEEFNRHFFHRGDFNAMHHSVLNVDGFYKAAGNCMCGAIASDTPGDCACQLGKCTVEFRVFNGTASWKKLHAYIALCQSFVAFARAYDCLDVDDFPPNLYNAVGILDDNVKRAWIERLTWMFKNLWFSPEERESINYCIEHSELNALTYAQRKALRDITYEGKPYVNSKGPRKPAPAPSKSKSRSLHSSQYAEALSRELNAVNAILATSRPRFPSAGWVSMPDDTVTIER